MLSSSREMENQKYFEKMYQKFIDYFVYIFKGISHDQIKKLKEFTHDIFEYASEKRLLQGRDREPFIFASIYVACDACAIPLQLKDFQNTIPKQFNHIKNDIRLIKFKILPYLENTPIFPHNDDEIIIKRYSDTFKFSPKHVSYASSLIQYLRRNGLNGKGLIPSACYIVGKTNINNITPKQSQRKIAHVFHTSSQTIRSYLDKIREMAKPKNIFEYDFFRR